MPIFHRPFESGRRGARPGRRALIIGVAATLVVAGAGVLASVNAAGGVDDAKAATSGLIPVTTSTSQKVLDSIGINIHENYVDTVYAPGGDTDALVAAIRSSGVGWVRIGLKKNPFSYERGFLDEMHRNGVKVLGILGAPASAWDDFQTGESAALITSLSSGVYAGRVDMLEMPNEYDISGAEDWTAKVSAFAKEYSAALRGNASTKSIPIVGPSVAAEPSCAALGTTAKYADFFNVHSYSGTRVPEYPVAFNCRKLALTRGLPSAQPLISTEFGWNTSPKDPYQGLPETAVASYLPRSYLWNVMNGIDTSFAYELFDQRPDPAFSNAQMHFGLVSVTGRGTAASEWTQSPKPAFASLQRLTSLLRDRSKVTADPIAVRWAAGTDATDAEVMQIKRSDGSVDVAVWLPIAAQSKRADFVTLQMNATPRAVSAVDIATGKAVKTSVNGQRLTLKATSSMTVIRVATG